MTNEQLNFQGMALTVRKLLTDRAVHWQPLCPGMATGVAALGAALVLFDAQAQALSGSGTQGYTEARDLAEVAALDVTMHGLRAVQLDTPDPALAPLPSTAAPPSMLCASKTSPCWAHHASK